MRSFLRQTDRLLRGRDVAGDESPRSALPRLLLTIGLFGVLYGATMGTFGGLTAERWLQPVYSGLKVPLLLLVTFVLSLPSFFVLNTILGLRADFAYVLRSLVAMQAGITVILASLAPFTAFWYASVEDYNAALMFNALMFAIASIAGQFTLKRSYKPLIARDPRHRLMMRGWLLIYAFVGIQMGWVLRPFVGSPDAPTRFFRQGAWGNAYVEVFHIAGRAMGW
ncbi:hypothetical protein [Humisphaera borealis]|uniref:Actin-binding WH2 domain-containing protein n=1 Tax=Humisphaera borealis TaxID=2807512 RepID=A0A7M2WUR0_9BACT|nr:hypothetical protein [Humisphaera borealis]QOV88912.1 hypothetical protein IPV69_22205 [Humisphaera borealis]